MSQVGSRRVRVTGSITNGGLQGSDVGTRSQDEGNRDTASITSYQDLRRRKFLDYIARPRRPAPYRRNAALDLPGTSVPAVETTLGIVSDLEDGKTDTRISTIFARPTSEHRAAPAVPEVPTLFKPTAPTGPTYSPNSHFSQSVIPTPPPSPTLPDTPLTSITSPAAALSPSSKPSYCNNCSDSSAILTSLNIAPASYFSSSNGTWITSTPSNQATSTSSISSSHRTTFSTRTSTSVPNSTSRSTAASGAATTRAADNDPASVADPGSSSDPAVSSGASAGPNTPQVIGGVVGGIAGVAVILLIVLFFLRRYKQQLRARGALLEPDGSGRDARNTMSMRSSHTPLVAAVTASFKKMRPGSSQTTATGETGLSDRGFQRVAGRKIEPVLSTGGDGYGGHYGAFEKGNDSKKETGAPSSSHPEGQPLAGTSFYRDDSDFDGGHGSGTSTPMSVSARFANENRSFADNYKDRYHQGSNPDTIAVMRPSPARSPVTTTAGPSHLAPHEPGPTLPSDAPPTPALPTRLAPDGVGRSLVSQDSSRGSRFTESV